MKKRKITFRPATVFFIAVAVAFISITATYFYVSSIVNDIGKNQQMYTNLSNVEQIVVQNYIGTIDATTDYQNIQDGIVSGYINGLGDPYSYYLNQKNYKTSILPDNTAYIDIGIRPAFDISSGYIRVDFVRRGSPAEYAGLKTGDIITAVDGKSVTEEGYRNAVRLLSGEEGTTVILTVIREGENSSVTYNVTRVRFSSQTVEYSLIEQIRYIFINEFSASTSADFKNAVTDLSSQGAKGYIIDVRFNAGGDYEGAIEVLDDIMPVSTICTRREKNGEQVYTSDADSVNLPIIVVINSHTNGSAELFAAALRESGLAKTVGNQTAGNALAQTDIVLTNNTAVHLSVYEYIPPSGETYNGKGVVADVEVSLDSGEEDNFDDLQFENDDQLSAAIKYMKEILGII